MCVNDIRRNDSPKGGGVICWNSTDRERGLDGRVSRNSGVPRAHRGPGSTGAAWGQEGRFGGTGSASPRVIHPWCRSHPIRRRSCGDLVMAMRNGPPDRLRTWRPCPGLVAVPGVHQMSLQGEPEGEGPRHRTQVLALSPEQELEPGRRGVSGNPGADRRAPADHPAVGRVRRWAAGSSRRPGPAAPSGGTSRGWVSVRVGVPRPRADRVDACCPRARSPSSPGC